MKVSWQIQSQIKSISSQKINHRNTKKKRGANNCIRKFEMLFHE
jgi:hypothetical protein